MTTIESSARLVAGAPSASVRSFDEAASTTATRGDATQTPSRDGTHAATNLPGAGKDVSANIGKTVERLNVLLQQIRRELRFSVDKASGQTVITVIDADTDEVVRRIPPDQVLTMEGRLAMGGKASLLDVIA